MSFLREFQILCHACSLVERQLPYMAASSSSAVDRGTAGISSVSLPRIVVCASGEIDRFARGLFRCAVQDQAPYSPGT
eukprot:1783079-Rhodomonas_salina.2